MEVSEWILDLAYIAYLSNIPFELTNATLYKVCLKEHVLGAEDVAATLTSGKISVIRTMVCSYIHHEFLYTAIHVPFTRVARALPWEPKEVRHNIRFSSWPLREIWGVFRWLVAARAFLIPLRVCASRLVLLSLVHSCLASSIWQLCPALLFSSFFGLVGH